MALRATALRRSLRPLTAALCAAGATLAFSLPAHAESKVYVSSEKDNKLYVFNTAGERQGAIDVCKRPRDMKFNADGSGTWRSSTPAARRSAAFGSPEEVVWSVMWMLRGRRPRARPRGPTGNQRRRRGRAA